MKKKLILSIAGLLLFFLVSKIHKEKSLQKIRDLEIRVKKNHSLFYILNLWLWIKEKGQTLEPYFMERGYCRIAIYGFSYLGQHLFFELKNSAVSVEYAIDRKAKLMFADVPIYLPDEKLPDVDVIVVTAVTGTQTIKNELTNRLNIPVISIEDVVFYLA